MQEDRRKFGLNCVWEVRAGMCGLPTQSKDRFYCPKHAKIANDGQGRKRPSRGRQ